MDVRTWMLVLFYFGVPSYILWVQWQSDGKSTGRALGMVILWLGVVGAVPLAFAILVG